jgi:hypothetical protein
MAGMQVRIIYSYYIIATITLGEPEETRAHQNRQRARVNIKPQQDYSTDATTI